MGIKLGPKLELSFWAIGYIVVAVTLLIVNISWIAGSLHGIFLGMKERNVFKAETDATTAEYIEAIQKLLKEPDLDPRKREALQARAARLSYNLGQTGAARELYEVLSKSTNADIATRAEISVLSMDFDAAVAGGKTPLEAATAAIARLDALKTKNPNSTEIIAARGALLMNWFNTDSVDTVLPQVRALVKTAHDQEKNLPGNIEARRNLLLMDLAARNFDEPGDEAAEQVLKNLRLEAKRIAPYIKDVQKSQLAIALEEIDSKVADNALGPPTLNKIPLIPGLRGDQLSDLANHVAPGVAASLDSPNAKQNLVIALTTLKNAQNTDVTNPLNYQNYAALQVRYAMTQNENLEKALDELRARGAPLPIPFGNSASQTPQVTLPVSEMERALADAYTNLSAAVANPQVPTAPKTKFARQMCDLALWRAALLPENARAQRLTDALQSATLWQTFDPKNCEMMVRTAQIYELQGNPSQQTKWLAEAKANGCKVGDVGPLENHFDFVTVLPGNPIQVGTLDYTVRKMPVLIGATFTVTGYTNPVNENTLTINLNGTKQKLMIPDGFGIGYALVTPDKLTEQNKIDFRLALSPQLQKASSATFKFESK